MIRKASILLTILALTAAFAFAQTPAPAKAPCSCLETGPYCCCPDESCCRPVEQETSAPTGRVSRPQDEDSKGITGSTTSTRASRPQDEGDKGNEVTGSTTSTRVSRNEKDSTETAEDDISSHIPESIRYNEYYLKSIELSQQAQEAYDNGFYDGSVALAEEALYYAHLSDQYVTEQLIAEAKRLVEWADANNIETRYPNLYHASKEYYSISLEAQENSELNEANIAAINVIEILGPMAGGKPSHLPSRYTVRSWAHDRDCLWNIAGYPFVYGDPWKWRILYDANKSRMPFPNNPNIIEPGFILDIPNLPGENRSGMWDPHSR